MALPSQKLDRPFTYGEYLTWTDDERWEIIDGIPVNMGPAPMRKHQKVLGTLYRQFYKNNEVKGSSSCEVYLSPFDVRLPEKDEADNDVITVVQPDLVLICDSAKLDDRGCRGAPDLVIEVLSPSSAKHDLVTKRALYEHHGVREYWVVQPMEQIAIVYILNDGSFDRGNVYTAEDDVPLHILPEVILNLKEVFSE